MTTSHSEYMLVKNSPRLTTARPGLLRPFLVRGEAYCRAMLQSTSLPRPIFDRRASLDCRVGWGPPGR